MAAKVAIQDLEEHASELHAASADAQAIKDEIVRIGVKYQIASSETSFNAVGNFNFTSNDEDPTPAPIAPGGFSTSSPAQAPAILFDPISFGAPILPAPGVGFPTQASSPSPSSSFVPSGSPTSSPTESPTPVPSALCFSGDNMVQLLGGDRVALKHVRVGDIVECGHNMYSKMHGFGHRDDRHNYEYLVIDGQGLELPLEISDDHMVFVSNRGTMPAKDIKLGDELKLGRGDTIAICGCHVKLKTI